MKREELCDLAKHYTTQNRNTSYGEPEQLFKAVADRWSLTLGTTVTSHQVVLCMLDLKVERLKNNPQHVDSWVDIAGYAACGAEITTENK